MAFIVDTALNSNENNQFFSFNWRENPEAKKLLDALVTILVEEYIQVAKQNPEIFSK